MSDPGPLKGDDVARPPAHLAAWSQVDQLHYENDNLYDENEDLRRKVAELEAEAHSNRIEVGHLKGRVFTAEKDAQYLRYLLETDGGRHA